MLCRLIPALILFSGIALAGNCSVSSFDSPILSSFPGIRTCRLDRETNYHKFFVPQSTIVHIYLFGPNDRNYNLYLLNRTKGIINSSTRSKSDEFLGRMIYPGEYFVLVNRSGSGAKNYTLILSGEEICEEDDECDMAESCLTCDDCSCPWDRCCAPSSNSADGRGCIPRGEEVGGLLCCDYGKDSLMVPEYLCLEIHSCAGVSFERARKVTLPYRGKPCSGSDYEFYAFSLNESSVVLFSLLNSTDGLLALFNSSISPLSFNVSGQLSLPPGTYYLRGKNSYTLELSVLGSPCGGHDAGSAREIGFGEGEPCSMNGTFYYAFVLEEQSVVSVEAPAGSIMGVESMEGNAYFLTPGTYVLQVEGSGHFSVLVNRYVVPDCTDSLKTPCIIPDGSSVDYTFPVTERAIPEPELDYRFSNLTYTDYGILEPGTYTLTLQEVADGSPLELTSFSVSFLPRPEEIPPEDREEIEYNALYVTFFVLIAMAYMLYFKSML